MTGYLPHSDDRAGWRKLFLRVLFVSLAFRLWLANWLPFTGDEAYFYYWGKNPDWGFYDHPPMVGWWLTALAAVSEQPWVLRLPALLAPPAMALLTHAALAGRDPPLAWGVPTLLLLAPLNALNVAITTDVPLMLFAFGAMLAYLRALRTGRSADYLFAGLLLGGALLSKYFAGMLALALGGHRLFARAPGRWRGLALLVGGTLPAAAIQVAWNAQHCWPNVMFNLVNRHANAGWSWTTPWLYAASLAYVLGPVVLWWLLRPGPVPADSQSQSQSQSQGPGAEARAALGWMTALPFALFALLSAVKTIGLHWLASFVAPATWLFALQAAQRGPVVAARRIGLAMVAGGVFALLHYVVLAGLAVVPVERFAGARFYTGLVMTMHGDELIAALEPWRSGHVWATDGYSSAVTLGFNDRARRDGRGDRVIVFGPASSHARHDDILTDFRALAGRDFLIVLKTPPEPAAFAPFFERIEVHSVTVRGATYPLVRGVGFRYDAYRDGVLEQVRRRFYALPDWLPRGPCYLCDRYFPERACHR